MIQTGENGSLGEKLFLECQSVTTNSTWT